MALHLEREAFSLQRGQVRTARLWQRSVQNDTIWSMHGLRVDGGGGVVVSKCEGGNLTLRLLIAVDERELLLLALARAGDHGDGRWTARVGLK